GVLVGEHGIPLVPGPAEDVALPVAGAVEAPLLDVTGHVIGAERPHAGHAIGAEQPQPPVLPHLRRPGPPEVAPRDDGPSERASPAGPDPVVNRRQALPRELGEGGGLVPTHPGDRELVLAVRVTPLGPGCRPWLARLVPEQGHRLVPRQ